MAEACRNRTYRSTYRRPYGFEVRQAHQHPYTSIGQFTIANRPPLSNDARIGGALDQPRAVNDELEVTLQEVRGPS